MGGDIAEDVWLPKFQPFIWTPLMYLELVKAETTVYHCTPMPPADAVVKERVMVVIVCPTVMSDWHCPGLPSDRTDIKE